MEYQSVERLAGTVEGLQGQVERLAEDVLRLTTLAEQMAKETNLALRSLSKRVEDVRALVREKGL